jgi:hypothetical protein
MTGYYAKLDTARSGADVGGESYATSAILAGTTARGGGAMGTSEETYVEPIAKNASCRSDLWSFGQACIQGVHP